nr:Gfo/Idh/MocA family oxidoreductase [Kiritimatiellia bacterium]
MSDLIRIGIIGAGTNSRLQHLPRLQAIKDVSLDVVCNQHEESSRRVAKDFQIPRIASNWEEVVQDPELDAIVIGTWPYLHAPITLASLAAGKHVLCEARMAMNAKEAADMLAASEARPELVAQVVPSPFTLPWDRYLAHLINEGRIGDLLAIDVFANCGSFMNTKRPFTWRDDIELSGLNTMMLGIYYEAMVRWVGHADTVNANGHRRVPERIDADGNRKTVHVPDHLDVFGDLECGAGYHIRCSQVTGACPTPNDFILYGSDGTLRLNIAAKELTLTLPSGASTPLEVPDDLREEWRVDDDVIGAVLGQESFGLKPLPVGV